MGLFRRHRKVPSEVPGEQAYPDPDLSRLSVADAAHLRVLTREWFAQRSLEVALHPGHVALDNGHEYGLWNLSVACAADRRGRSAWPRLVDQHFRAVTSAMSTPSSGLTDEEFEACLRTRLVGSDSLQPLPPGFDYGGEWAPGLSSVLTLDLPSTVQTLNVDMLTARGSMSYLLALGWAHTASLVTTEDLERDVVEHEGRWFWSVLGESVYTASLALMLPDVVRRFDPAADVSEGIIFAVPHRHQLAYRVVAGPESVMDALTLLPGFAAYGYAEAAGGVSPRSYYWRDGVVTAISEVTAQGSIAVTPHPELLRHLTPEA